MSSTLESSVTLEDVFVVVGAKRVPLAAELAGYLALEIAEGATQAAGDVDPRSVYIGEEGSVALVRPRRDLSFGDAEGSIRTILGRLLEASGSQTPALASVARRHSNAGLGSLVEELEAALIPVNRAAGRRRALAAPRTRSEASHARRGAKTLRSRPESPRRRGARRPLPTPRRGKDAKREKPEKPEKREKREKRERGESPLVSTKRGHRARTSRRSRARSSRAPGSPRRRRRLPATSSWPIR